MIAEKKLKSRYGLKLRAISLGLVLAFFAGDLAQAAPSAGALSNDPAINPSLIRIPQAHGRIQALYKGSVPRLVVHVQDAHVNLGAQENIAAILEKLIGDYGVRTVFLEGGTRDDSLDFLHPLADAPARERVAKKYLMKGELNGAEYLSLASDRVFKLIGVEDAGLYRRNLETYAHFVRTRESIVSAVGEIRAAVSALKRRMYAPAILAFDETIAGYHAGKTSLTDYHAALIEKSAETGIDLKAFSHFHALGALKDKESRIDFAKAEAEQKAVFSLLAVSDPARAEVVRALASGPSKVKAGSPDALSFYEAFLAEARKAGVSPDAHRELSRYVDYLSSYSKLDLVELIRETDAIERGLYARLLADADVFYLHEISSYLSLLEKLYTLKISSEEFAAYLKSSADRRFDTLVLTAFVNRRLHDAGSHTAIARYRPEIEANRAAAEDFYRTNEHRDRVFVDKTLRAMEETGQTRAALLTGGYHTESLKELLKLRGVSYVTITPHVVAETNQKRYEELLLEPLAQEDTRIKPKSVSSDTLIPRPAVERKAPRNTIPSIHRELAGSATGHEYALAGARLAIDAFGRRLTLLGGAIHTISEAPEFVRDRDTLFQSALDYYNDRHYVAALERLGQMRAYLPPAHTVLGELQSVMKELDLIAYRDLINSPYHRMALAREQTIHSVVKMHHDGGTQEPKFPYDEILPLENGEIHAFDSVLKQMKNNARKKQIDQKAKSALLERTRSISDKAVKVDSSLENKLSKRGKKIKFAAGIGAAGQSRRAATFANFLHYIPGFGTVRLLSYRIAQFAAVAKRFAALKVIVFESPFTRSKVDTALKDKRIETGKLDGIERVFSAITRVFNADGSIWRPESASGLAVPSHGDAVIQLAVIIDDLLDDGYEYYGFFNMNVVNSVPDEKSVAYLDYLREEARKKGDEEPWVLFQMTTPIAEKGGYASKTPLPSTAARSGVTKQVIEGWMLDGDKRDETGKTDKDKIAERAYDFPLFNTNAGIVHLPTLRRKLFNSVKKGHLKRAWLAKHPETFDDIVRALSESVASYGNPDPENKLMTNTEEKKDPDDPSEKIYQVSTIFGSLAQMDPNSIFLVVGRDLNGQFFEFKERPQTPNLEASVKKFAREGRIAMKNRRDEGITRDELISWILDDDIVKDISKGGQRPVGIVYDGRETTVDTGDPYDTMKALYEMLPSNGRYGNILVESQYGTITIPNVAAARLAALTTEEWAEDDDAARPEFAYSTDKLNEALSMFQPVFDAMREQFGVEPVVFPIVVGSSIGQPLPLVDHLGIQRLLLNKNNIIAARHADTINGSVFGVDVSPGPVFTNFVVMIPKTVSEADVIAVLDSTKIPRRKIEASRATGLMKRYDRVIDKNVGIIAVPEGTLLDIRAWYDAGPDFIPVAPSMVGRKVTPVLGSQMEATKFSNPIPARRPRVAINGAGNTGATVIRHILLHHLDTMDLAVVNGRTAEALVIGLQNSTEHGPFPGKISVVIETNSQKEETKWIEVELENGRKHRFRALDDRSPLQNLPWRDRKVDIVIDATGKNLSKDELQGHLEAGAKAVLLTAPSKGVKADFSLLVGVNHREIQNLPAEAKIFDAASCTTSAYVPALVALGKMKMIASAMVTVHAYTNTQFLKDTIKKDNNKLSLAADATQNMIQSKTGSSEAVGPILPELKNRLSASALRVPAGTGSIAVATTLVESEELVTRDTVNALFHALAAGELKGIIAVERDLVSSQQIVGRSESSILLEEGTDVIPAGGNRYLVRTMSWYDNEWGYSSRVVDAVYQIWRRIEENQSKDDAPLFDQMVKHLLVEMESEALKTADSLGLTTERHKKFIDGMGILTDVLKNFPSSKDKVGVINAIDSALFLITDLTADTDNGLSSVITELSDSLQELRAEANILLGARLADRPAPQDIAQKIRELHSFSTASAAQAALVAHSDRRAVVSALLSSIIPDAYEPAFYGTLAQTADIEDGYEFLLKIKDIQIESRVLALKALGEILKRTANTASISIKENFIFEIERQLAMKDNTDYLLSLYVSTAADLETDLAVPLILRYAAKQYEVIVINEAIAALIRTPNSKELLIDRLSSAKTFVERQFVASVLDRISTLDEASLRRYYTPALTNVVSKVSVVLENNLPTFSEFAASTLAIGPSTDLPVANKNSTRLRLLKRIDGIQKFKMRMNTRKESNFFQLASRWGFDRVSRWAAATPPSLILFERMAVAGHDTGISLQENMRKYLYFRQSHGPISETFDDLLESDSKLLADELIALLLSDSVNLDTSILSNLIRVAARHPANSEKLLIFLIAYFRLKRVDLRDEDFIQEDISRLLNSDMGSNYYLVHELVRAIPFFTNANTAFRKYIEHLDQINGLRNPLFHYLRLQIHRDPGTIGPNIIRAFFNVLVDDADLEKTLKPYMTEANLDLFMKEIDLKQIERLSLLVKKLEGYAHGNVKSGETYNVLALQFDHIAPETPGVPELFAPLLSGAPVKEVRELVFLIQTYQSLERRHSLDVMAASITAPLRIRELEEAGDLVGAIREIRAERSQLKAYLLQPIPEEEFEEGIHKDIATKRHIIREEYGFLNLGKIGNYQEPKFDAFIRDRSLELYEISLMRRALIATAGFSTQFTRDKLEKFLEVFGLVVDAFDETGLPARRTRRMKDMLLRGDLTFSQMQDLANWLHDEYTTVIDYMNISLGPVTSMLATQITRDQLRPEFTEIDPDRMLDASELRTYVEEKVKGEVVASQDMLMLFKDAVEMLQREADKLVEEEYTGKIRELTELAPAVVRFGPKTGDVVAPEHFAVIGGKGLSLIWASELDLPVPPGFILTTALRKTVSRSRAREIRGLLIDELLSLESVTGKEFPFQREHMDPAEIERIEKARKISTSSGKTLLLAVRSGSFISMPGMMETGLNSPMNDTIVKRMIESREMDERDAYRLYGGFLSQYGQVVHGLPIERFAEIETELKKADGVTEFNLLSDEKIIERVKRFKDLIREEGNTDLAPQFTGEEDSLDLLMNLVYAVFDSWDSARARDFRRATGIAEEWNTAVTLQEMIYGDIGSNSGFAVAFSRNTESNDRVINGSYKAGTLGSALVDGTSKEEMPIAAVDAGKSPSFQKTRPGMYKTLEAIMNTLDQYAGEIVEAELVNNGEWHLVQWRSAPVTRASKSRLVLTGKELPLAKGVGLSNGATAGRLVFSNGMSYSPFREKVVALRKQMDARGEKDLEIILVTLYMTPEEGLKMTIPELTGGISPVAGNAAHAMLVTRKYGKSFVGSIEDLQQEKGRWVIGDQELMEGIDGTILTIDGHPRNTGEPTSGHIYLGRIPIKHKDTEGARLAVSFKDLPPNQRIEELTELREELLKESKIAQSGRFVRMYSFSDQHGAASKMDAFIVHALKESFPEGIFDQLHLEMGITLKDALGKYLKEASLTFSDLRERIYFHNLGDFMDRGDYGVHVWMRSRELVELEISDYVSGNHDLFVVMSLMGIHLPWYDGYNYEHYSERENAVKAFPVSYEPIEDLVRTFNETLADKDARVRKWAEIFAQANRYNTDRQTGHWYAYDNEVNGEHGFDKGMDWKTLSATQKSMWGRLRGTNSEGRAIPTGVKAVGKMSLVWWHELLGEMKSDAPQNENIPVWNEAMELIETRIIPELAKDLHERIQGGEWYLRAVEALYVQNHRTAQWAAWDWSVHKGWGVSVFRELTKMMKTRVDEKNYLQSEFLKTVRDFFQQEFNLYTEDVYLNFGAHALLPYERTTNVELGTLAGRISFIYKDALYRGDDENDKAARPFREGLDRIADDIRSATSPVDALEAFNLVYSWYADSTTIAKPANEFEIMNNPQARKNFFKVNGIRGSFIHGHNSLSNFEKYDDNQLGLMKGAYSPMGSDLFAWVNTDGGASKNLGDQGYMVAIDPLNGISTKGFLKNSLNLVTEPTFTRPDGSELFANRGLAPKPYRELLLDAVQTEIGRLNGARLAAALNIDELLTQANEHRQANRFDEADAIYEELLTNVQVDSDKHFFTIRYEFGVSLVRRAQSLFDDPAERNRVKDLLREARIILEGALVYETAVDTKDLEFFNAAIEELEAAENRLPVTFSEAFAFEPLLKELGIKPGKVRAKAKLLRDAARQKTIQSRAELAEFFFRQISSGNTDVSGENQPMADVFAARFDLQGTLTDAEKKIRALESKKARLAREMDIDYRNERGVKDVRFIGTVGLTVFKVLLLSEETYQSTLRDYQYNKQKVITDTIPSALQNVRRSGSTFLREKLAEYRATAAELHRLRQEGARLATPAAQADAKILGLALASELRALIGPEGIRIPVAATRAMGSGVFDFTFKKVPGGVRIGVIQRTGLEDVGDALFEGRLFTHDEIARYRTDSKNILDDTLVGVPTRVSTPAASFTARDVQMAIQQIVSRNPALGAFNWWNRKNINAWNEFKRTEPAFLNALPGETYVINLPLGAAFDENGDLTSVDLAAATFAFAEMMKNGRGGELLINFYSKDLTPDVRSLIAATLSNVQLAAGQGRLRFGLVTLPLDDEKLVRGLELSLDPKLKVSGLAIGFESTRPYDSIGQSEIVKKDELHIFQVELPKSNQTLSSAMLFGAGTMNIDLYDAFVARFTSFAAELQTITLPNGQKMFLAKPRPLTEELRTLLTHKRSIDSAA